MITFIPLEFYAEFYYYVLLVLVIFFYLTAITTNIDNIGNLKSKNTIGHILLVFIVLYIGLRPISGLYFGDMIVYANTFDSFSSGEILLTEKDVLFQYFMLGCSKVMSVEFFFLLCAILYVLPLYLFSKKVFKQYWFYSFLILVISFSFWSYGTNGIRNGIATSIFLYCFSSFSLRKVIPLFLICIYIHKSALILVLSYLIVKKVNNPKLFFFVWLISIPTSLVLGSFLESFFLNIGFNDDGRLYGYLGDEGDEFKEQFSSLGFRWDFLLYSVTGVFAGWYFIFKKGFNDLLYNHIWSFYLLTNAFWILIIRATFSNRFAYLSWFIMGICVVYPFLKYKFFNNQHVVLGRIILAYFFFTFLMNVVLV